MFGRSNGRTVAGMWKTVVGQHRTTTAAVAPLDQMERRCVLSPQSTGGRSEMCEPDAVPF